MVKRLSGLFLFVCGSAYFYYGALGLVDPEAIIFSLGISAENAAITTEIRSSYGGQFIGIGLFLYYSSFAAKKVGLIAFTFIMIAIGLTRLYGIIFDASNSALQSQFLAMELIPALIALILLGFMHSQRGAEAGETATTSSL